MTTVGWPTWLGVVVDDLAAQTHFYKTTMGFRLVGSGDGWVHFDVAGHLFELLERDGSPQYNARRYQVGFTVDDLTSAREAIVRAGATAITGIEGDPDTPNRWSYFKDPEGNVFELTEWRRDWRRPSIPEIIVDDGLADEEK
jgi:catechol 2,3-dioxygenase-like lactoylglutathione lyase family enzyme